LSGKWVILFAFCMALDGADAADTEFSPQVWLNAGLFSYHFDRSLDLRENNVGFGAEILVAPDHALMAGTYINSNRARTHYGAYQWRPLHWQPAGINVNAGIVVGAFDGYPNMRDGGWFIGAMPVLSVEGKRFGANFTVVPTIKDRIDGAVAVQLKLRVW
jgi:hypothetical protein